MNPFSVTLTLELTPPQTEVPENVLGVGGKVQPGLRADSLISFCEPIV
jgi:hypothetical protein